MCAYFWNTNQVFLTRCPSVDIHKGKLAKRIFIKLYLNFRHEYGYPSNNWYKLAYQYQKLNFGTCIKNISKMFNKKMLKNRWNRTFYFFIEEMLCYCFIKLLKTLYFSVFLVEIFKFMLWHDIYIQNTKISISSF